LAQAYGEGYDGDGDALDVYVRRLLMKLARPSIARDPLLIQGEGYVFDARARPRETIAIRRDVS
jgi:DNA-binding response OmpR family regulator